MPGRQYYADTTTLNVGNTTTTATVLDTTVIQLYKHSFSDTPSVHPYLTVPNTLNSNLSGSSWTNSRGIWTNYSSNTSMGKAIAMDNSTADTATVTLSLNIASGKKVGIRSFSFYQRVSNSGYRHWKLYINGIEVGDSTLYYPATGGTGNNTVQSTGTRAVGNPVEDLTGTMTVLLKLYDHDTVYYPHGNAGGTFRMDDFTLNGYVNDATAGAATGGQYVNNGGYRYGFNGKENDEDVKGEANQQDYGERIYDPRLGRFLSVDPLTTEYPYYTPYQFAGNDVIRNSDLDGSEPSSEIKKGFDFSKAKLNRIQYTDYGSKGANIFFGLTEGTAGMNTTVAAWNQVVNTAEDATNLVASSKGRKSVIVNYGSAIVKYSEWESQLHKNPTFAIQRMQKFFTKPENLENIAAAVFLLYASHYIPTPGLKIGISVADGRNAYIATIGVLKPMTKIFSALGVSEETIARLAVISRRGISAMFKYATPKDLREWIFKFNEKRYGDPLGPTYDYFKNIKGKTNAQIIQSVSKPLGGVEELGQSLYKEFGNAVKPILEKYNMMPKIK